MKKAKAIFDRAAVILFNVFLILSLGIATALLLASSPSYYHRQFEKNGIYAQCDSDGNEVRRVFRFIGGDESKSALFTDGEIDALADHIVDYLFGDGESFALTMDGVYIRGEGYRDGVNIFGDTAVRHMADVKRLIGFIKAVGIIASIGAVLLLAYFITASKSLHIPFKKYTLIFWSSLILLAAAFCIWSYLSAPSAEYFSYFLWKNLHYVLFFYSPEKRDGSFFDDTLTQLLRVDLFIDATVTVIAVIAVGSALWLVCAGLIERRSRQRLECNK